MAAEFAERDSGWALLFFSHLDLNVNKYNPLRGNSYIELPKKIAQKRAVLNVNNSDSHCFLWCILAHLHPVSWQDQPHRVSHYVKYRQELDLSNLEMPLSIKDVKEFEKLNDISVNVYGLEQDLCTGKYEIIGPLHFTRQRRDKHVNLLLISNDEGKSHYCLIRNLSRLLSSQFNSHGHSLNFCDGCLNNFTSLAKLQQHQMNDCTHICTQIPSETKTKLNYLGDAVPEKLLSFQNYKNKFKAPFVIYADFEALLMPIHCAEPDPQKSSTTPIVKHLPHSFAYYIKCDYDDSLSKFFTYRGEDCVKMFNQSLTQDVRDIWHKYLKFAKPMALLSEMEELAYQKSTHCHICSKGFTPSTDDKKQKVRDHCHFTGVFRGAAHSNCNLNFKRKSYIPCFFHNLSNYDAHLFIKELGVNEDRLDVIAQNKEKYICFTKQILFEKENDDDKQTYINIKFLDSCRFMASSLDKLASNLDVSQYRELTKFFPDPSDFNLVRQKGVYPYSFTDSFAKLSDTTTIPTHEQFYDKLHQKEISFADYDRAQKVWNHFNCRTLGDYSDLYLKCDVLLLADVFENFRDVCMKIYKLDPVNYPTAPSLAWEAMLKHTQIELELLTDIDMIHFLKKGIRGGISQCSTRRAVANNQFTPNYDPSKPSSYLAYLDKTNLYGAVMSMPLPRSNFTWLTPEELEKFDLNSMESDENIGHILEVDLDYPDDLHDLHNDLPFCAESIIPPGSKSKMKKLIPNLFSKKKYAIHYKNLIQAMANGLLVTKVHRVLKFNQSAWLKSYIDLNTEHRNRAVNKFEKDFFKLMNNAVFGKTMENVDKRIDVRLATHWSNIGKKLGAESLIAKPQFKNCTIFSENLIAIQLGKTKVIYDKPIYLGFCVLELSKHMMYDFYYNYIKAKYGDKVTLLYMDTDSFIIHIYTDNFYHDMKQNLDLFDTSNFQPGNIHGIPPSVSIIGKMKDEYAGQIVYEAIGTGSKAYAVDVETKLTTKAKGVPYHVTADFKMDTYREVVDTPGSTHQVQFSTFRSRNHEVFTEMQRKVALSYFDDKRVLIPNSYKTYAWGHYKLC